MSLLTDVPVGVQTPAWSLVPPGDDRSGQEAVDLADLAGLRLDEWQQLALRGALRERPDEKWAAFEVAALVPRQNGKGSILEARELAGLFLFGEELILHSAHEFKTAQEAFRRILFLVQNTPDLDAQVARVRTSHGEEGIELKTGQRLRFVARSTGSGRGFTGDVIILDEAYNLSARAMAALVPTMAARPNPQLWYASSAPLDEPVSDVLRALCRRGRAGQGDRLAYFEWSARPPDDVNVDRRDDLLDWAQTVVGDPDRRAEANPALGIRVSPEFIDTELEALGPAEFVRERLGIWFDPGEDDNEKIPRVLWNERLDVSSQIVGEMAMSFDVSPDGGSGSIGVAGPAAGGIHVEVIEHRAGTGWMVDRLVELTGRWDCRLVNDPKGSGGLLPKLEERGVEVELVTADQHAQACAGFAADVREGRLVHIGQDRLNLAVREAGWRPLGDAWLWSRKGSAVDISPLVAVTLARWASIEAPDPTVEASSVSVW